MSLRRNGIKRSEALFELIVLIWDVERLFGRVINLSHMKIKHTKSVITILFVLAALAYGWMQPVVFEQRVPLTESSSIDALYANQISGEMVLFEGEVSRILPDDNKGSRHQRFIVVLPSSHTVLVAHNIDLAARVPLQMHQPIKVFGQYEWNKKGGVVHWTHKDPRGIHIAGWIEYQGRTYH